MSDIPSTPPTGSDVSLQQQCAALQKQVSTLLIATVVISATLSFYLWRQSLFSKGDLDNAKQSAGPALQVFRDAEKPKMEEFVAKVAEFGRKNPDFVKLLNSHNMALPNPPAGTPAPAPAPAAGPKPK